MLTAFPIETFLGGIGLFLLGMIMMTDGVKGTSGPFLAKIIEKSTNTSLKGFFSGFFVTALIQSSTATTLLAIGFVNIGILSFVHALWVLFGANVGTSMTVWIIALVGQNLDINAISLPIIALGVLMRLMGGAKKWGSLGIILAGFGILFLGLSFLKDSFADIGAGLDGILSVISGKGAFSIFAFIVVGFILTILMQSSSGSIAVILTLAGAIQIPIIELMAAIIGANVGTTLVTYIVAIGGNAGSKRVAMAHILFNVITGVAILAFFPVMIYVFDVYHDTLQTVSAMTSLAVFHTVFNVFGALLMVPLAGIMVKFLQKKFKQDEDATIHSTFLDEELLQVPHIAIEGIHKTLDEYHQHIQSALDIVVVSFKQKIPFSFDSSPMRNTARVTRDFIVKIHKESLDEKDAQMLAQNIDIFEQSMQAVSALETLTSNQMMMQSYGDAMSKQLHSFFQLIEKYANVPMEISHQEDICVSDEFEKKYLKFRDFLLRAASVGTLKVSDFENISQSIQSLRTIVRTLQILAAKIPE